jgi:rSAM/selenodomain-associated transferase 2
VPLVSIVVPVLDDFEAAAALLGQLPPDGRTEIVLADGSYDARLDELVASRPDARIIRTQKGRGRQMNGGAAASRGTWLWFLHADSHVPDGWISFFEGLPAEVAGGWFRFGLDHPAWQARVIETGVRWRVRLLRLPYGDQGLFVRADLFGRLRGYAELPLMEDVEFVRRLRHAGPVREAPLTLRTSARRWDHDGWLRRSAANAALITLYLAGVPAATLARHYPPTPR